MGIPILTPISPVDGDVNVDPNTSIILEITEATVGVDPFSVLIILYQPPNDQLVWELDASVPPFTVTKTVIANGFRYEVVPSTPLSISPVEVYVSAADNNDPQNLLNQMYSFSLSGGTDDLAITPIAPLAGAVDVDRNDPVIFKIFSTNQVLLNSTSVKVRDALVYAGSAVGFSAGWQQSKVESPDANSYIFYLIPDIAYKWQDGENVKVNVKTQDNFPATKSLEWFFVASGSLFPFQVHKFILDSMLEMDKRSPSTLSLISSLQGGLTDTWREKISERIDALRELRDPLEISDALLPYLGGILGFPATIDLPVNEQELRVIYANAMRYWAAKNSELVLSYAVRMVTGNRFLIRDFFDLRMMAIDPVATPDLHEAAFLFELREDQDPNLLDFPSDTPSGSNFRWFPFGGNFPESHTFVIGDLPDEFFPNGVFQYADGWEYLQVVSFPDDPSFEGFYKIYSLNVGGSIGVVSPDGVGGNGATGTGTWRLWRRNSEYITEIRVVDNVDTPVNKPLLRSLIDLVRRAGERIDVYYVSFLDQFLEARDVGLWDYFGDLIVDGGFATLVAGTIILPAAAYASSWGSRTVYTSFKIGNIIGASYKLHVVYVDDANSYIVEIVPDSKIIRIVKRAAAVNTILLSTISDAIYPAQNDSFRVDVMYIVGVLYLRLYFDGTEVATITDAAPHITQGSIACESVNADVFLYHVEVIEPEIKKDRIGAVV